MNTQSLNPAAVNEPAKESFVEAIREDMLAPVELPAPTVKAMLTDDGKITLGGLSERFANFVRSYAEAYQIPLEMALFNALTVAGAAIGGYVSSRIASHVNKSALWTVVIARSAVGKSAPLEAIMQPINDADNKLTEDYNSRMKEWDRKIPQAKPEKRQLVVSKQTGAAREIALTQNPRGVIYYRDEIAGLFMDLNGFGGTSDPEDLNTIFDGRKLTQVSDLEFRPIGPMPGRQPVACCHGLSVQA